MICIPNVIESDLLSQPLGSWGTRVERVVSAVPESSSAWDIGRATQACPVRAGCPCKALALHCPGRVCGRDAVMRMSFRRGYMCSVGCWLSGTAALPPRDYYALVERVRRALSGAVGTPTVMRHPNREAEVMYRWEGDTAHVQMLSDHLHDRTIAVIANDPWICRWCSVH